MESNTIYVSLDVAASANTVTKYIIEGSLSGELLDDYNIRNTDGNICRVLVFEKYYYRVGNRLTLTVVFDNYSGRTRVHYVSGGGGQGAIFRFDWGSSDSFSNCVYYALQGYIV
jgi:hypothetical protein